MFPLSYITCHTEGTHQTLSDSVSRRNSPLSTLWLCPGHFKAGRLPPGFTTLEVITNEAAPCNYWNRLMQFPSMMLF